MKRLFAVALAVSFAGMALAASKKAAKDAGSDAMHSGAGMEKPHRGRMHGDGGMMEHDRMHKDGGTMHPRHRMHRDGGMGGEMMDAGGMSDSADAG